MSKVCIIGCGNIGSSIAKGLVRNTGFDNSNLVIAEKIPDPVLYFREYGVNVTTDNIEAVKGAGIIIVAVKPHDFKKIIVEISPFLQPGQHVLVSLVAGMRISQIQEEIPADIPVYRAMPNIAAKIGESMTCLANNLESTDGSGNVVDIFNLIGKTIEIEENLMEAATALGACGIAYVMKFVRAMMQGGIQLGFNAETAKIIVNQTVKGAAETLIQEKQHPETEIDKVTTPKGCTIVGLNEMEHNGFSSSLIKGIVCSFKEIERKL